MKYIFFIMILLQSCSYGMKDDPLIIPPNFSEIPTGINLDKQVEKTKEEDLKKLKDLLLKVE